MRKVLKIAYFLDIFELIAKQFNNILHVVFVDDLVRQDNCTNDFTHHDVRDIF